MALYLFLCHEHGSFEQWFSMDDFAGRESAECPECSGHVQRVYTPPADHSDNSFRAYYSDQLSLTGDPIYVKTKSEWRDLQTKRGLTPYEKGMAADKKRHRKEENDKAVDKLFKEAVNETRR